MVKSTLVISLTLVIGACSSPEPQPTTEAPVVDTEASTPEGAAPPRPDSGAPSGTAVAAATHGDAHVGENEADQMVGSRSSPERAR